MAKKIKLEVDYTSGIELLAISCHKKDYWLAFKLNQQLKIDLRRIDDLNYYHPQAKKALNYPTYFYAETETHENYHLISNFNPEGKLFLDLKNSDYFILISGNPEAESTSQIISGIKDIQGVLMVNRVDLKKLKDLDNFISDLELHMIEIET